MIKLTVALGYKPPPWLKRNPATNCFAGVWIRAQSIEEELLKLGESRSMRLEGELEAIPPVHELYS